MSPDWANYAGKAAVIHCTKDDGTSAAAGIQRGGRAIEAAGGTVNALRLPGHPARVLQRRPARGLRPGRRGDAPGPAPSRPSGARAHGGVNSGGAHSGRVVARAAGRRTWRARRRRSSTAAPARAWSPGGRRSPRPGGRAFRDQDYWGRPVPGFGAADARIAHPRAGAGRARRQPHRADLHRRPLRRRAVRRAAPGRPGQPADQRGRRRRAALTDTRIFAAVRCAPPDNKPTPAERDTCAPWLHRELELISPTLRVVVALGAFAWAACWPALSAVYGVPTAQCRARRSATGRRWSSPAGAPDAARVLPRQPAEHLYRPAHAGDAGRRLRPGQGAGRDG